MTTFNLIAVFDFYLIVTFILSTVRRIRQYRAMLGIIFAVPGRWPKLFDLVKQHRTILINWQTVAPIAATFLVTLIHTIAYNGIWHMARVTPSDLADSWLALLAALIFGAAMVWLDFTAIVQVWEIDRPSLERDLDQAEYWLRSWMAPAVRILTFGFVNPRSMVSEEVRKALTAATRDLNTMMWRWALQIAMRLFFGLTLWLTWWLNRPGPPINDMWL
jgi:hypothetical protein